VWAFFPHLAQGDGERTARFDLIPANVRRSFAYQPRAIGYSDQLGLTGRLLGVVALDFPRPRSLAYCCLQPRYRSVVWTETWPSMNWICSSSPPADSLRAPGRQSALPYWSPGWRVWDPIFGPRFI